MQFDRKTQMIGAVAIVAIAAGLGLAATHFDPSENVRKRLEYEVPRTSFSSVTCDRPFGCEAVAGKNVVYVTPDARYLFLGDIIDLKQKVDITQKRQQEVAVVNAAAGAILGNGRVDDVSATGPQPTAQPIPQGTPGPRQGGIIKITLPAANGIVHNPGAPLKISVFSDYGCHFCKAMFDELVSHPEIQVTEYPVAMVTPQSEQKAQLVLCARDRLAAGTVAFNGGQIQTLGDCRKTDGIVDQNTKFARDNGLESTPVLIRADGRTQYGFAGVDQLKSFVGGAGA